MTLWMRLLNASPAILVISQSSVLGSKRQSTEAFQWCCQRIAPSWAARLVAGFHDDDDDDDDGDGDDDGDDDDDDG